MQSQSANMPPKMVDFVGFGGYWLILGGFVVLQGMLRGYAWKVLIGGYSACVVALPSARLSRAYSMHFTVSLFRDMFLSVQIFSMRSISLVDNLNVRFAYSSRSILKDVDIIITSHKLYVRLARGYTHE